MISLETKSKVGSIVHLSILINATFTFLLVICVAQQQREIINLREILNEHTKKQSQNIERMATESSGEVELERIKSEITQTKVRLY